MTYRTKRKNTPDKGVHIKLIIELIHAMLPTHTPNQGALRHRIEYHILQNHHK